MPEVHLRQPGFTNSACRLFTKNKGRIQKFKKQEIQNVFFKKELGNACFQYDMA